MLKVLRSLLNQIIDDIDSENSTISETELQKIIDLIQDINLKKLNKTQAYTYLGVCRATFDNYIKQGKIPKGEKEQGSTLKMWYKKDLDKFLEKYGL